MTTKTLQAWGAGCGLSLLLRLGVTLALLGVIFGCMLVIVILPPPAGMTREQLAAIALALAVPAVVGLALVVAVGMVVVRGRQLDALFAPLDLAGGMLGLNGRQYHGTVNGRRVDAYFYRGPTLELYLSTPLQTRLTVGRRDRLGQALAGLAGRTALALDDVLLEALAVYPLDEAWARGLLNDARVRDLLLRLTDTETPDAGPFEIRHLVLQPDALLLRLSYVRLGGLTAEALRGWLNDLAALLRVLEAAPPPSATATASPLERTLRTNRTSLFNRGFVIAAAVLVALCGCAFTGGLVAFVLSEGG